MVLSSLNQQIFLVAIDNCTAKLEEIKMNPDNASPHLSRLPDDLKDGLFMGHAISRCKRPNEFEGARTKFIDEILQNISKRFPATEFLSCFSVLAMRPISFLSMDDLSEWGNREIKILAEDYGHRQTHTYDNNTAVSEAILDPDKLMEEWSTCKKVVKAQLYPRVSMASL